MLDWAVGVIKAKLMVAVAFENAGEHVEFPAAGQAATDELAGITVVAGARVEEVPDPVSAQSQER